MLGDGRIAVLKGGGTSETRNVSDFYFNARPLNDTSPDFPYGYIHQDFLEDIGRLIGHHAETLEIELMVGIKQTGATIARFGGAAAGIPVYYINPHRRNVVTDGKGDLIASEKFFEGKRILVVDDVLTSGGSLLSAVLEFKNKGAIVVGALVLVRRKPDEVGEEDVGLGPEPQSLISLINLGRKVVDESPVHGEGLLSPGAEIELSVGYAATDGWAEKYPQYKYVGTPNSKG